MRVKIEIEGAPPEVNAALAASKQLYGVEHVRAILHVALKVRVEDVIGDLDDTSEPVVKDLSELTQQASVIAEYERSLWELDPVKIDRERRGVLA